MYAVIKNSIVTNVVEWDGDIVTWAPPSDCETILVQDGQVPHIGLGYANGIFEQPVELSPYPSGT